ncbi:MAG: hypothetical protein JWL73_1796 [Actinomycetia bacterium]|nr:hypothetical protein [Actinomycetes bacterium]
MVAIAVLVGPRMGPTFGARPAGARTTVVFDGEHIRDYHIDLAVQPDGKLKVRETIVYDFGTTQHHGIDRRIKTRLRYDGRYDRVYPISDVHVSGDESTPANVKESSETGGEHQIRIGDPDKLITGVHTYNIDYTLAGTLNRPKSSGLDELSWNAVGDEWEVGISRATVTVSTPAAISRIACYAGATGSRVSCAQHSFTGSTAQFSQASLFPGSGLSVVVGFPPGTVPRPKPILEERWSFARAFALTPVTVGTSAVLLVLIIGGFGIVMYRIGRDRRYKGSAVDAAFGNSGAGDQRVPFFAKVPVPVEFVPIDGMRPGLMGALIDERANALDVTATIVDLASRGFLTITEIPKHGLFGHTDWTLTSLDKQAQLIQYERTLLDGLFAGRTEVKLSELKNTFATKLQSVESQLYDELVRRGWYSKRPDKTRAVAGWIGVGVLAVAVTIAVFLAVLTHAGLIGIPLVLGAVFLLIAARTAPSRTPAGTAALIHTLGFKRFIDESEKNRAQFAEKQNLFTEYLPYAVVFGATERWAKAFTGLDGQAPTGPSWYVSNHPFAPLLFVSAMDSFTTSAAGTISSTPGGSGSSGFSGGGFSGGGGGGGGGGSW